MYIFIHNVIHYISRAPVKKRKLLSCKAFCFFFGKRCAAFSIAFLFLIYMIMMMMMRRSRRRRNCFYRMIYYWKALRIISNQDHCRRFSLWQASDTPQSGSEPSKNLSSKFGGGSYAVLITITPRRHNTQLGIKLIKMKNLFQLASVIGYLQERWCFTPDTRSCDVGCFMHKIFIEESDLGSSALSWWNCNIFSFEACMLVVSRQCW